MRIRRTYGTSTGKWRSEEKICEELDKRVWMGYIGITLL